MGSEEICPDWIRVEKDIFVEYIAREEVGRGERTAYDKDGLCIV